MVRIHLCTGVLERGGAVLLVASRYPNLPAPVWNLPGGRQRDRELLSGTLVREFLEETGLLVAVNELLYVSESYDGETHFTNATFAVSSQGDPVLPEHDAHVVAFEWVGKNELAQRLSVGVVREPLLSHLSGSQEGYYGYAEAGISIEFAD